MTSLKKIITVASVLSVCTFSLPSILAANAQSHGRDNAEILAGAPLNDGRDAFQLESHQNRSDRNNNRHSDRSENRHHDSHGDRHDSRHNDTNRYDNDRRNSHYYTRQWEHADHNYNAHNGRNNTHYNSDNYRHRQVRQSYTRVYSYPSSNRYYNRSRYDSHNHLGNQYLYCPDHSGSRYHIGGRYSHSNTSIVISDYDRRGLYAPPRGHHWVHDNDSGDAILASVATGAIIGLVVGILASEYDDDNYDYHRRRR